MGSYILAKIEVGFCAIRIKLGRGYEIAFSMKGR